MTWHIVTMQKPMPDATDLAQNPVFRSMAHKSRAVIRCGHLFALMALSTAACGPVRDHFPMKNSTTGQEVTCYSGYYWFEEGLPEYKIAEQCISACERYGFRRVSVNDYYKPNAKAPDTDMKQFIPAACLP